LRNDPQAFFLYTAVLEDMVSPAIEIPGEFGREVPAVAWSARLPPKDDGAVWLTPGRYALLLGALLLAMFPAVFLGGETFFFRDFGWFGLPLAHYHHDCFWRGTIPLWNPLSACGLP
jgi:hypothetical protein